MALKIAEQNGTFFVNGVIDSSTASSFLNHFQYLMKNEKMLTVNIDEVSKIDTCGMMVLYKLHMNSLIHSINFKITGKKSDEIYQGFYCTKVA